VGRPGAAVVRDHHLEAVARVALGGEGGQAVSELAGPPIGRDHDREAGELGGILGHASLRS